MSSPQVSVLMPVYNAERYVAEAVKSILWQTFTDFEFIIINDGSTDQSQHILQTYADRDNRIRLISRENKGLVATLNEMIALAKGEYLARMDADDIAISNRFDQQVDWLNKNSNCVVVGSWLESINELGQFLNLHTYPTNHIEIDSQHLKGFTTIAHPTAMIRKDAIQQVNGYDAEFQDAEDLDLWLRIAEVGMIAILPKVLLQYRIHGGAISTLRMNNQKRAIKMACERAWERRQIKEPIVVEDTANEWWRPGVDKKSQYFFALRYGWNAWNRGHKKTWWNYSKKAILLEPLKMTSWKLLIFGFLKYPKKNNSR